MFFPKLASLKASFSVKHVFLNRISTFTYRKRVMYGFITRTCSNCLKHTNLMIILKIMYKRKNFQQNLYGKGQFQTLLKA